MPFHGDDENVILSFFLDFLGTPRVSESFFVSKNKHNVLFWFQISVYNAMLVQVT